MNTKEQIRTLTALAGSAGARYRAIAEKAARTTRILIDGFHDSPDWVSGWGHAFVCPDCAGQLTFDPARDYRPGGTFVCGACGRETSGQALDEAWVYYYRHHYAARLEAVAVTALLGDEEALAFLIRFFDFYADSYAGFAPHVIHPSKLMPQLLDEAVWCTYVLRALYPCRDLIPAEKLEDWKLRLFRPLAEVILDPKYNHSVHNHVLWHMAAAAMAALTFDDETLTYAIDGEYGIRAQVEGGFTSEGFWFECSQLYHYYALEALTGFCQLLADRAPDDPLLALQDAAYTVPMLTSYDGWHLPAMNDGWYPLDLSRFSGQIHRAAACTASVSLKQQIDTIRAHKPSLLDTPAALLLETPPEITATIPTAKMAVIRAPMFAILKSGVIAESHRQDDCLGMILPPVSDDLGTPGYAHPLYRSWYCTAASHNTVLVNGTQPHSVIPTHVEKTDDSIRAVIDGGWDGVVSACRTLRAAGDTLIDETELVTATDAVIDWVFHLEGVNALPAVEESDAAALLGEGDGYAHFTEVHRVIGNTLSLRAEKDGHIVTLTAPTDGMEVFLARSPGNPAGNLRTAVILRTRGTKAHFCVTFA